MFGIFRSKDDRQLINNLRHQLRSAEEVIKGVNLINKTLTAKAVRQEQRADELARQNQRLKKYVNGEKVYSPLSDLSIEISLDNYLEQYSSNDGIRRHAFMAGVNSILNKIKK